MLEPASSLPHGDAGARLDSRASFGFGVRLFLGLLDRTACTGAEERVRWVIAIEADKGNRLRRIWNCLFVAEFLP
jgi:hypothetical protein